MVILGATFALRRKFSARHYWEDVRKYNVTVLLYIGELCRYLLAVPEVSNETVQDDLCTKWTFCECLKDLFI